MGLVDNRSWWHADSDDLEIAELTVGGLLAEAVEAEPDREAVVVSAYDDPALTVRWTYRDLDAEVDQLGRALMTLGIEAGDRVAIWGPNLPHWVVAELAVGRIGAVLVPLNPTYRHDEVAFALKKSDAACCLVLPGHGRIDLHAELRQAISSLPSEPQVLSLGVAVVGVPGLAELPALAAETSAEQFRERTDAVRSADLAQIQFTSGTTGRPKGAMLTHRNLVNNARQTAKRWQVTAEDRWCSPLPLFHTAGCGTVALGAVSAHATFLPLVRFETDPVLKTLGAEACTILETVPTILTALTERQRTLRTATPALRLIGTSGAPTPEWHGRESQDVWGARLRVLYGSTEVSPTVSGTAIDDDESVAFSTVGHPLPWLDVRIVDLQTREVVPVGDAGEIEVKGYSVMAGYLDQPDATAAVLRDGWFAMGDMGTLDDQGYLRVVGRIKDVIIRGGENLYPAEIEELIRDHDAVLDVAVVGVPDHFFGEEVCAVVTVHPGRQLDSEELRGWMRARVTHQKVPRYVSVVEALPQTTSGKIQKFRLREQIAAHEIAIDGGNK